MPRSSKPLKTSLIALALVGAFVGCVKTNSTQHPASAVPGTLYVLTLMGSVQSIDANTGTSIWTSPANDGPGAWNCPLSYDSGLVYFGNQSGVNAYNSQTGTVNWSSYFGWDPSVTLNNQYRGLAFQDSLVYYTSPTGVYIGPAYLYCSSQASGRILWKNLIDSSQSLDNFNGMPYVVNGKVVTLMKDQNGYIKLVAFDCATGNRLWASGVSNALSPYLHITNNQIFCTIWGYALCYSATDGSLQWQTTEQFPPENGSQSSVYTFDNGSQLIVCRNFAGTTNYVEEFDMASGAMTNNLTINYPEGFGFYGYGYQGGVLYTVNSFTSTSSTDSTEIRAYDLVANKPTWKSSYALCTGFQLVVTPNYVIVPTGEADTTSYIPQLEFFTLDGKPVKSVPYTGSQAEKFMYIDNSGILYKEADF